MPGVSQTRARFATADAANARAFAGKARGKVTESLANLRAPDKRARVCGEGARNSDRITSESART